MSNLKSVALTILELLLTRLLLDDLADGKDYASLKREAEDRSMRRIRQ